jgi:preprotein translocase subunit SecA
MGQRDPLSEWQREGFDMFEAMLGNIADDFARYVFHLEVVADDRPRTSVRNLRYTAADDPVQGSGALRAASVGGAPESVGPALATLAPPVGRPAASTQPVRAARPNEPVRVEKSPGRNEPCWCGSGKKFKMCHGR